MSQESSVALLKILSFKQSFAGLRIAASDHILWPCHAFKAVIPGEKIRQLNIFEETVLKMTSHTGGNRDRLSKETCIPKDLIEFIQCRLHHLNYVDARYDITKNGRQFLSELESSEPVYQTVTVYFDLRNKCLLPFVNAAQHIFAEQTEHKEGWVTFKENLQDGKRLKAFLISPEEKKPQIPKPGEIIKAIKAYKTRYSRYSHASEAYSSFVTKIPPESQINVEPKPELVYLHCIAAIQEGNPDIFIVTDGFGIGYSEQFSKSLTLDNKHDLLLSKLKRSGGTEAETNEVAFQRRKTFKVPYPEIAERMEIVNEKLLEVNEEKPDSTSMINKMLESKNEFFVNIYGAIEWAFKYVVTKYSAAALVNVLETQDQNENKKLLSAVARKIGFSLDEKEENFFKVKPGALKAMQNGEVVLQPLFALSLASASENETHPLKDLCAFDPSIITFLFAMKRIRDAVSHSGILPQEGTDANLSEVEHLCKDLLRTLLPNYVPPDMNQDNSFPLGHESERRAQYEASLKIDNYFGVACAQMMDQDLRNLLQRVERTVRFVSQSSNFQSFCNDLYAVLQTACESVNRSKSGSGAVSNYHKEAEEKAEQAGMLPNDAAFPRALASVSEDFIKSALIGVRSTLGASFLAFLILFDNEELKDISKIIPPVIETVDTVLRFRGHGNASAELPGDLEPKELLKLKENVFAIIKTLMEMQYA